MTTSSLIFTGQLPLAWRELPTWPDETELRTVEQSNLAILHTLFALDIHAGDHSDDPGIMAFASELKRLDFKISLLLELVGQLLARQKAIPLERALSLTVSDLCWDTDTADAFPLSGTLLQLGQHAIDTIRRFAHFLQEDYPPADLRRIRGTAHGHQHAQVAAYQSAFGNAVFQRA